MLVSYSGLVVQEKRKSSDEPEEVQVKIVSAVDNGAH